ncbi:ArsR/SmtB family transcription factor [Streptomyces sp. NPDC054863]
MWETILSLHRLQRRDGSLLTRQWSSSVRAGLPRGWELLGALVPRQGYFPDFLTPATAHTALATALDEVLSSPREVLARDMAQLADDRPLNHWTTALGTGRVEALARLERVTHAYHRAAVQPYWGRIEAQVLRSRATLAEAMAGEGVEGLLAALPPAMRWRRPVLEVDYPVHQDLRLGGRGILLVPSFFCHRTGVTLFHNDRTPVLVHPVEHVLPEEQTDPGHHTRSLAALLGHTRAAVLGALSRPGTTGELASRTGVLPSSASQHATVLREAGLVRTVRDGKSVRHTLTPLGAALRTRGAMPRVMGPEVLHGRCRS